MSDPRSKVYCEKCFDEGYIPVRTPQDPVHEWGVIECKACKDYREGTACTQPKPERQGNHWDNTWMDLAIGISKKATCSQQNRQVGCVIVSSDNTRVLALGYNGGAKGGKNTCIAPGSTDVGASKCTCVHAEMNALTKLNPTDPCEKTMYLTLSPCALCWKLIVNAGINKVIFLKKYERDVSPISELISAGVQVEEYQDNRG